MAGTHIPLLRHAWDQRVIIRRVEIRAGSQGDAVGSVSGDISEVTTSPSWAGPTPAVSVTVSTWGRAEFLPELISCLERQTMPLADFEVVIVDNGSSDTTWAVLSAVAGATSLRLCAGRLDANRGSGGGRNAAVSLGRSPIIAFTDDDCLATPGWIAEVRRAFDTDADFVQGRTLPDPTAERDAGPWDHSVWVTGPTALFETCNIAYRRRMFDLVGGFDEVDPFTTRKRRLPFGEDAVLGARIVRAGGAPSYAEDALVYHRYLPSSYSSYLKRRRQVGEFPGLARRSHLVRNVLWHRVFLSRRTAAFDLAVACGAVAALSRRAWPLIGVVPWLRECSAEAARRPGRTTPYRVSQVALGDAVGLAGLLLGSARHGRLVV